MNIVLLLDPDTRHVIFPSKNNTSRGIQQSAWSLLVDPCLHFIIKHVLFWLTRQNCNMTLLPIKCVSRVFRRILFGTLWVYVAPTYCKNVPLSKHCYVDHLWKYCVNLQRDGSTTSILEVDMVIHSHVASITLRKMQHKRVVHCLLPSPRTLCFFWFGFVCLSVCLLATLPPKLTDFDKIFREGQKWHKDQLVRFWRWS